MCLGSKFLEELRPAQTRVNIQVTCPALCFVRILHCLIFAFKKVETNSALQQADVILQTRRKAREAENVSEGDSVEVTPTEVKTVDVTTPTSTNKLSRPAPPANKPPPPPVDDESEEEVKMDTRAVVPEIGAVKQQAGKKNSPF